MAMSGSVMGTAIKAALDALPDDPSKEAFWQAVAGAVVAHIQGNALVSSTVAVTSVSGVAAGGASSGPGAGTATGTVS